MPGHQPTVKTPVAISSGKQCSILDSDEGTNGEEQEEELSEDVVFVDNPSSTVNGQYTSFFLFDIASLLAGVFSGR